MLSGAGALGIIGESSSAKRAILSLRCRGNGILPVSSGLFARCICHATLNSVIGPESLMKGGCLRQSPMAVDGCGSMGRRRRSTPYSAC